MNRKETRANVIGGIGAIALGLGIFGLNVPEPGTLHFVFGNHSFVLLLTAFGALLMIIEFKMLWPIWRAKQRKAKAHKS